MSSDLQSAFRAALFGAPLPRGVTARAPSEATRRFDVYRNNVAYRLTRALAERFSVIERLVAAPFFAAMAGAFIAAHPPQRSVIAEYGTAFPGFLAGFPPVAHLGHLPDVARIELARGAVYHAADADPAPGATLVARDPGDAVLTRPINGAAFAFFAALQGAPSLTAATRAATSHDAGFDPVEALALLFEAELVSHDRVRDPA